MQVKLNQRKKRLECKFILPKNNRQIVLNFLKLSMSRDLITYSVYIFDNTNIWLTVFIVLSRHTKTAIWLGLHCIFHFSFFSPQFFVVRLNRINGEQKKAKQIPLNCSIFMEFASPGSKGICNGPGTGRSSKGAGGSPPGIHDRC